jgi:hypothetical protein
MTRKILKKGFSTTEYSVCEHTFRFEPGVVVEIPEEHVELVMRRLGNRLEDAPEGAQPVPETEAVVEAEVEEGEKPKKGGKK